MIGSFNASMLLVIMEVRELLERACEVGVTFSCRQLIFTAFSSAGIPTIIHPFFGDQFFWADRVEALGVGSGVRKLTADALAEALVAATTDIKQIDRAKIIGQQIRAVSALRTHQCLD
jgi:hypothetical protein